MNGAVSRTNVVETIRRWGRKERISADKLNQVVDAVNRLTLGVAPPRQKASDSKLSAGAPVRYQIAEIHGDYLMCRRLSGNVAAGELIAIAKSPKLRRTPFDGETENDIEYTYTTDIKRTADDGSGTEEQVVVPAYYAGDEILAVNIDTGITDADGEEGVTGTLITWLDLNIDGRAWAKSAT